MEKVDKKKNSDDTNNDFLIFISKFDTNDKFNALSAKKPLHREAHENLITFYVQVLMSDP